MFLFFLYMNPSKLQKKNDFQEGNKSGTVSLVGRYVFYLCTNSKLFLRISQVIESKLFLGISHRISLKEV